MKFIFAIIAAMLLLDGGWWAFSMRVVKGRLWRLLTCLFMGAQLTGFLGIVGGRMTHHGWDRGFPKFASTGIFIWHFFGLAISIILGVGFLPIFAVRKIRRWNAGKIGETKSCGEQPTFNRRKFIEVAAAVAPPLFTINLTAVALAQLNGFRVRKFILPIPNLPRELDGLTIAQVSDIHVGRFTSGRVLREMVKTTNDLRADLVLLTGDLINDALADLSEGLDLARAMQGRFGLYMIEGNHDLIENGAEFERRARMSGVPFLRDESTALEVRGVPVQILGLRWDNSRAANRDEVISASVRELLKQRQPDAFPILLAHHPHAFDAAAESGVPLTLSGHTHGGQLMLSENCGFGPAIYRYWSGLYRRDGSQMIVSNGVGNWFPLRINAPAEIVHITLRA